MKLWGREQDAQRWEVFRYTNRTHNTLTVDGQLQHVDGYAAITGHSEKAAFSWATTDLSAVYAGQLAKAQRGVAIAEGRYVVVRDEVETAAEARTVRWTLLTPADVRITGKDRAELTKDGKQLVLQVQQPAGVTPPDLVNGPAPRLRRAQPGYGAGGF